MANGLQKVVGEEASETVRFVRMMDHGPGTSENPNCAEFCKNTQALRVINTACAKGNCRGNIYSAPSCRKRKRTPSQAPQEAYHIHVDHIMLYIISVVYMIVYMDACVQY